MIKYSVIIPVYQCKKYLEQCVNSVLNQSNNNFEILLIDDGSSDGSAELAEALSNQSDKIRVFHKENGGAASARNRGILEAKGQFLLFLDCDDTIENTLLEDLEKNQDIREEELIIFGMSFDYYRGGSLERSELLSCAYSGRRSKRQINLNFEKIFADNAFSSACNKVFSKKIISENNLLFREGMHLYEDFDFVLRYMMQVDSFLFMNKGYYHYRNCIDENHFNKRILDIDKLKQSQTYLLETMKEYSESTLENHGVLTVAENLFMQLLNKNILENNYSTLDISKKLPDYCNQILFRNMINQSDGLTMAHKELLEQIDHKKWKTIYLHYKKKKIKRSVKKNIKRLLRCIGKNK